MPNLKWNQHSLESPCPECCALNGQIHPKEVWDEAGLYPGCNKLSCGEYCKCSLDETTEPEKGDLLKSVNDTLSQRTTPANFAPPSAARGVAPSEQRTTLSLTGSILPGQNGSPPRFEILAITAGEGNGWKFSADSLQQSLPLWDGAECFIDHSFWGHSIKDLAGVCHSPQWDAAAQGVKLTLRPVGPSAPLLIELGSQMLSEETNPKIGFSADLTFTAKGKEVQSILKIYSVDLVFNPARGGAFVRALNSIHHPTVGANGVRPNKELSTMPEQIEQSPDLHKEQEAVRTLMAEQERIQKEAEAARQVRIELCGHLLESALSAASLPPTVAGRIRKQFSGQVFEPSTLNDALEDARKMVSELTGGLVVQGPGRISAMFSSEDQLQTAVDDMLEAPRSQGLETLKVSKLSGIRELYVMLTGDDDLHGGYYSDRARLATTADFTGLVKNALNKIVVNTWDTLGKAGYDWWNKIVVTEHFNSLQSITGTLVGTVGALPEVAEGAEYTELAIGDSPETATWKKYGGYIPLTLELIDRDETRKLKAYPRELAAAGLRKISALVSEIFTANSGTGPTLADTGALFNATAVTTAGGHANLLTAALAADKWDLACQAVYAQPMLVKNDVLNLGSGPAMAVNPRFLLVPRALQLTGMKILYPSLENAANIYSENQQRGQPGDVITVPEWTDATDWAAVCDPRIAPAIYIGERFGLMPEIFIAGDNYSPAVFMNDEHRLKVRHFLAVWVNDFRPLHKSNVAG
ncbi:MAG: hypothetical protein IT308_07000 [Anaerolineaceae bacterium]|nr:hypothetical protein [Anaerolineaceae bacterium]